MSDFINTVIGIVIIILGIKGLIGLWGISGILAVVVFFLAAPIVSSIALIQERRIDYEV